MNSRSEFLIGAAHSGSGKTLLTLALLRALSRRNVDVQPFKCGPDFIDPTLHKVAAGKNSINLDLSMMGANGCLNAHERHSRSSSAVVVEGVMGLFDGGEASSAALAQVLGIPVVLVIDVRSAAESVAAVIKGFELFDSRLNIVGVICNRVGSPRHRQLIEEAVIQHCQTPIIGFFPRNIDFALPSRHLGLIMGHELKEADEMLDAFAETIEEHIDIDRLLEITKCSRLCPKLDSVKPRNEIIGRRLAIARDEAFCFYYQDNFDILKDCGFDLIEFSPLHDQELPENIDGIYLGGGYPELFAEKLALNEKMKSSIHLFAENGGFIYGECGGFMYMTRELHDQEGRSFPMCGVFDVVVQMKNRLSRLGYRQPVLKKDSLFGYSGEQFYGHEFHYSDIVYRNPDIQYLYVMSDGNEEGCKVNNAFGSYIHLHFAKSEESLNRLCQMMQKQD